MSTEDSEYREVVAESKGRFFLEVPFIYLVNPDMLPAKKLLQFPLGRIIHEFYEEMKKEEELDFKILGMSLKSAARLHRMKVSQAISYERKLDKDYDIKRKKGEFVYDRPLRQYMRRPEMSFTSESAADAFYEQLMVSLRASEEKKRRRRDKMLTLEIPEGIEEDDDIKQEKGKRKRRIRFKELSVFDAVLVDFDRIEIDVLINDVLKAIKELSKGIIRRKEVPFEQILRKRVGSSETDEKWRLEQVRILMSLLYLIKEEFVEAWQDLKTGEISVIITKKGMKEKFGFKDAKDQLKKKKKQK